MALPRGDEYNQAVQNPTISFADSELKSCQVETTPLGLPKPYSGGFTTTYKLRGSNRNWAVRCFTREINDLQQRYQSIGSFLNQNNCTFLVDAKYLHNGIRISGNYYPIIKMKWLDGEPLNAYIDRIHSQKSSLEGLLKEFTNLVKQLENYGIAHGDLQHGNIMVKNSKLFLIDYDGMYLPDLANLTVNELGHPNFQHPRRTAKDYNKYIDRFSSIIIYTAIKAVSLVPALWRKYDNGDNLLFKGSDFADSNNSALLKDLSGYTELSRLANNIAAICSLEFSKIPTLEEFLSEKVASSTQILAPATTVRSAYLVLNGSQRGKLLEHIGERVEVIGRIGGHKNGVTRNGDPYQFINFGSFPHHTFTIVLWSDTLSLLQKSGIGLTNLKGKHVSVTGVLNVYHSEYRGEVTPRPQIAIDMPSQFQILAGESEAQVKLNYRTITSTPEVQPIPKLPIKEEDFWNNHLKNRPVTPPPTVQPPRVKRPSVTTQPKVSTTSNTSTNKSPTQNSSKSKKDSGFAPMILGAIIGGVVVTIAELILGISTEGGGAIIGILIGGWICSKLSG